MAFEAVPADAYDRFMGRFSRPLAVEFASVGLSGVAPAERVLDVGCGPGILTAELAGRLGEPAVSAVDPAPGFVNATATRLPRCDVRRAVAEELPYRDGLFDAALAQLVVHFMRDPVAGVGEMRRVTRAGGRVSACVWDHAGDSGPLTAFWRVVRRLDPGAEDESRLAGAGPGQLASILGSAGLEEVSERLLTVTVGFAGFDDWWEPFTFGVGPAGDYVTSLDAAARDRLAEELRAELGAGPFRLIAGAWTASGLVPGG